MIRTGILLFNRFRDVLQAKNKRTGQEVALKAMCKWGHSALDEEIKFHCWAHFRPRWKLMLFGIDAI